MHLQGKQRITFLVLYIALKKFILSTKSAKRLKFSVPLICENIHIFCPQDGEINNLKSWKTKDIFVPLQQFKNTQSLLTTNNILSIFNSFTNRRIETIEKAIENLKQEETV